MVFLNWFLSILITFERDGWISSNNNTSLRWFNSYSISIYSRAACEWHQIQTTTVCLSNWEFRISIPSFFSWLMSLSVWCDLGLVLFRKSSIIWWSNCASIDTTHFSPHISRPTSNFSTAKIKPHSHVTLISQSYIFK